ncbi:MAG: hypothetical protein ACLGSH_02985 [Acidobacteriota bacterium]
MDSNASPKACELNRSGEISHQPARNFCIVDYFRNGRRMPGPLFGNRDSHRFDLQSASPPGLPQIEFRHHNSILVFRTGCNLREAHQLADPGQIKLVRGTDFFVHFDGERVQEKAYLPVRQSGLGGEIRDQRLTQSAHRRLRNAKNSSTKRTLRGKNRALSLLCTPLRLSPPKLAI